MEYTSKAVGNAALTTGIIGTALGALTGAGGLAGVLGIGPRGPQRGNLFVRKYERLTFCSVRRWISVCRLFFLKRRERK